MITVPCKYAYMSDSKFISSQPWNIRNEKNNNIQLNIVIRSFFDHF